MSVSCPTAGLCVAVDMEGDVVYSTDPTGGPSAWHTTFVSDPGLYVSNVGFYAVSCPTASLCVATDNQGGIATSTDPTGGPSAWKHEGVVFSSLYLYGISCPSTSLCVATSNGGELLYSTNPAAGASSWHSEEDDSGGGPAGVSCPTTGFCAAVDLNAGVLTTTAPTNLAAWSRSQFTAENGEISQSAWSISCPSSALCVAGGAFGGSDYSTNPAGGSTAWHEIPGVHDTEGISCPTVSLCVVAGEFTVSTSSNPTGGGSAWTVSEVEDQDATYDEPAGNGYIRDVDCESASLCVAVGLHGRAVIGTPATPHNLTVSHAGGGSGTVEGGGITCATGSCSRSFANGTVVELTAHAGPDSVFTGWTGGFCHGTEEPCEVTLTTAKDLTATFVPGHTLSVSVEGSGKGEVGGGFQIDCPIESCSGTYVPGTQVTLTAYPEEGSSFDGWSGGGCSGTGECTVTMNSDLSVAATFSLGGTPTPGGSSGGGAPIPAAPAPIPPAPTMVGSTVKTTKHKALVCKKRFTKKKVKGKQKCVKAKAKSKKAHK
jgi:hypothetical protein